MFSLKLEHTLSIATACVALIFAVGCGTSGVTVREGKQNATIDANAVIPTNAPVIVHVDSNERIVTIRNGYDLDMEFLIASTPAGKETAVLKLRKRTGGLKTADILEGEPRINNVVTPASNARSKQLAKVYRDPEA